ncbi:MAG: DUF1203 domain-containing protein [Actinomycetota bacterium]
MSNTISYIGINNRGLDASLEAGVDHGGSPIEPFIDDNGGWPLRCCLADSKPGDEIAIIAWSPFPWNGPYREVGPVVVHTTGCPGRTDTSALPADLDAAPMVLRPYNHDRRIAYPSVRHVEAGGSLTEEIAAMLADDTIDFVHARNVTGGCYSFTARRAAP